MTNIYEKAIYFKNSMRERFFNGFWYIFDFVFSTLSTIFVHFWAVSYHFPFGSILLNFGQISFFLTFLYFDSKSDRKSVPHIFAEIRHKRCRISVNIAGPDL